MRTLSILLREKPGVTDYIINTHEKKSYEMFFVKGKLETVRCTNTCDTSVTVYAAHDAFLGHADFFVYPSTTEEQVKGLIEEAVQKALLINNKPYSLPADEAGEYTVESNFSEFSPDALAAVVACAKIMLSAVIFCSYCFVFYCFRAVCFISDIPCMP